MDMVAISLLVILELAALLAVAVYVLNRKRKQLQAQLLAAASKTPETFDSIASGYLPYLEKQILESRDQLYSIESETDNTMVEALTCRLSLLESEKKVTERCNDYPENRWQHVAELFTPPEVPEPEQTDELLPEEESEGDDTLSKAQARIKRLEKFRDNFFAMKKQLKALEETREKLTEQLEALLPEAERSEELKALLDSVNAQRDRLQDELAQLESQSEELARTSPANASKDEESRRIHKLNDLMGQQHDVITSLKQTVGQVKEDPSADLIQNLEVHLKELEQRYRESSHCLEIMTAENERLQDKVNRKDDRIQRTETEKAQSVSELGEQIDKQKQKMSELYSLVDGLQLEAEKSEALQGKLDQFDLSNRDMNMCIQVLEEENEFLQEQIRSLLQMDEGKSIYNSDDAASNDDAELQQQLASMQAQLDDKDQQIKALEVKYASMEQEYLTLYEETNS